MSAGESLSELELLILRGLLKTNRVEDLAKEVEGSPASLGKEIARLQLGGYIADDGSLTRKGMEAAKAT